MNALGENRIGVLSDGGSIPLTSTRKIDKLRQEFVDFLYLLLSLGSMLYWMQEINKL